MENLQIAFAPELPLWLLVSITIAITVLCSYGLINGLRGSLIRSFAGALLATALFNPSILQEDRTPLPTIVPLVIDGTTSQKLDGRGETT